MTTVAGYYSILRQLSKAIIIILAVGIAIPLVIGYIFGIQPGKIFLLITSTLALQATAAPVGVKLNLPPAIILAVMGLFAVGMVVGIYEILDTLALSSVRVKKVLDKTEQKLSKLKRFQKYGGFACLFISSIPGLGLYSTPIIAWILRWNKWLSIVCTIIGFILVSIVFLLISLGLLK